jgi:hypothetical protein
MTLQRLEIKERSDTGSPNKMIVDLDEIIEKWVSSYEDNLHMYTQQVFMTLVSSGQ